MRHFVNFGLLFSFLTLAVSGAMAFLRPFSIVTTRVHVVFGLTTFLLVGLHLASRAGYFKRQVAGRQRGPLPKLWLFGVLAGWVILLGVSIGGKSPATFLLDQSYEARHRAEIVRSSPLSGFLQSSPTQRLVARVPADGSDAALSLAIRFAEDLERLPALAVWVETTSGSMIETLYLDDSVAYSDTPHWGGKPTPRHHILPLWRHRFTLVTGIDPSGQVDAVTGATASHSFSLDRYLKLGEENSFVLCVEVNAPHDRNETYPDPLIGQPSLLYTALIELDSGQPYALLELTGHGGGAEKSGAIQYDLENFTSAKRLLDLLLVKAEALKGGAGSGSEKANP